MTEELFRNDSYLRSTQATVVAVDDGKIRLDRTVFYPNGGGQPGDTGTLTLGDGTTLRIIDTVKGPDGVLHVPSRESALPAAGTSVEAAIDWDRRYRHMRMHTALHVLTAIVEGDVTGGQVGSDRSRLDFNLAGEVPAKEHVTAEINRLLALDRPVRAIWIADAELEARPELVKTMSVRPPSGAGRVRLLEIEGIDLQACGGTHVARTGEIGRIECVKIENKGRMNRRFVIALDE
jgi:misacylated tRNA(Ala) deacylase